MKKLNEICKELDDKEMQSVLERNYNDIIIKRTAFVNKFNEVKNKVLPANCIMLETFASAISGKKVLNDTMKSDLLWLAASMATTECKEEMDAVNQAAKSFFSLLEVLERRFLITDAEVKKIKEVITEEILLTESDLGDAA